MLMFTSQAKIFLIGFGKEWLLEVYVIFDDYGGTLTNGISKLVDDEYVKKDRIVIHNLNGHALMVKVL